MQRYPKASVIEIHLPQGIGDWDSPDPRYRWLRFTWPKVSVIEIQITPKYQGLKFRLPAASVI